MEFKQRKLNRLFGFDYIDGCYFVTICVKDRKEFFGEIKNKEMILNKCGMLVKQQWLWLKKNFYYVELYEFIIMPNHIHCLISIDRSKSSDDVQEKINKKILPLSNIVGAFKTTSSKLIHKNGFLNFNWQRSFFDRIIRNEKEMENIQNYILNNPYNWENDRNNKDDLFM
ncbi:MAG: transposase [Patescibacteria group bacterium]